MSASPPVLARGAASEATSKTLSGVGIVEERSAVARDWERWTQVKTDGFQQAACLFLLASDAREERLRRRGRDVRAALPHSGRIASRQSPRSAGRLRLGPEVDLRTARHRHKWFDAYSRFSSSPYDAFAATRCEGHRECVAVFTHSPARHAACMFSASISALPTARRLLNLVRSARISTRSRSRPEFH